MSELDKQKIGDYVGRLIKEKGYSDRQFAIKCLEERGWKDNSRETIQNMQNRICSIKKARKWIQVEDLPIFSKILGVSIEEILSAGNYFIPDASRMTNYSVAFSKDPEVWKAYIDNEDDIFLNYDEYGCSIIDYALQFKNYELLKYLLAEGIIWFVKDNHDGFFYRFGAGTSVKRRKSLDNYTWEYDIATDDSLRTDMASLAIERHDYDLLDDLHARETPELYYGAGVTPRNNTESFINTRLIDTVARSDKMVLKYFTESFSVEDDKAPWNHCIFPYISELVSELIAIKSKHLKDVLINVEKHNSVALKTVKDLVEEEMRASRPKYGDNLEEKDLKSIALHFYFTGKDKRSIRYTTLETKKSFAAVIASIEDKTGNEELDGIIDRINSTYEELVGFGGK